jgi:hypothetical protein
MGDLGGMGVLGVMGDSAGVTLLLLLDSDDIGCFFVSLRLTAFYFMDYFHFNFLF